LTKEEIEDYMKKYDELIPKEEQQWDPNKDYNAPEVLKEEEKERILEGPEVLELVTKYI
jgi:hypothetical protein